MIRFTRDYILDIIKMYPDLIRVLYVNFALTHYIGGAADSRVKYVSFLIRYSP
jgi:glutamate dehydrogenase